MMTMSDVDCDWCADADAVLSPTYASLLGWRDERRTGRRVSSGYRRFCELRGLTLLRESGSHDLVQLAEILDRKRVQDVLSAPRIAWRLLQNSFAIEEDGAEIAEAFIAEAALEGIGVSVADTIFSARCDFLIQPGEKPRKISRRAGGTPISIEVQETRNRLVNKGNAVNSELHTPEECNAALSNVCEGLRILEMEVPRVHSFVCDVMNILVLRSRKGADGFETGTFSGYAGLVLFTNTHLADTHKVIEGLVHEAVHCMLYMHESVEGGFLLNRELENDIVVSPWTGAQIRLQSFIHACFVWYSVYSLWQACLNGGWNVEQSSTSAAVAKRGFTYGPVTRILEQYRAALRPGILASLKDIESRVIF